MHLDIHENKEFKELQGFFYYIYLSINAEIIFEILRDINVNLLHTKFCYNPLSPLWYEIILSTIMTNQIYIFTNLTDTDERMLYTKFGQNQ